MKILKSSVKCTGRTAGILITWFAAAAVARLAVHVTDKYVVPAAESAVKNMTGNAELPSDSDSERYRD